MCVRHSRGSRFSKTGRHSCPRNDRIDRVSITPAIRVRGLAHPRSQSTSVSPDNLVIQAISSSHKQKILESYFAGQNAVQSRETDALVTGHPLLMGCTEIRWSVRKSGPSQDSSPHSDGAFECLKALGCNREKGKVRVGAAGRVKLERSSHVAAVQGTCDCGLTRDGQFALPSQIHVYP